MKIKTPHSPNRTLLIGDKRVTFHDGIADVEDKELGKFILTLKGFKLAENDFEESTSKSDNQDVEIGKNDIKNPSKGDEDKVDNPENSNEEIQGLEDKPVTELKRMAKALGVYKSGMTKQELIDAIQE